MRKFPLTRSGMTIILIGLVLLFSIIGKAHAHPHEFVTMEVKVNFDGKGDLTSMQYHWEFDELFSAYALEGKDTNNNGSMEQNELDALLVEILGNIHSINYFTKFRGEGSLATLTPAKPMSAKIHDRKLRVSFEVPFEKAINLNGKTFNYSIYDDEYYIAMNHDPDSDSISLINAPKGCDWDLEVAEPEEEILAFAGSLDKNESGGVNLGEFFAEWVSITCE